MRGTSSQQPGSWSIRLTAGNLLLDLAAEADAPVTVVALGTADARSFLAASPDSARPAAPDGGSALARGCRWSASRWRRRGASAPRAAGM